MPYEVELDNTLTLAGNQVFKAWPMYGIYSSESSTKSSSLQGAKTTSKSVDWGIEPIPISMSEIFYSAANMYKLGLVITTISTLNLLV